MISFRYHVVTLVSVFLALAVGIALGGGPLQGEVDDSLVNQIESDRSRKAALNERVTSLRSFVSYNDTFASALAGDLLEGTLEGRGVAIVRLPGSNDALIPEVTPLLEQAGAEVRGTYRIAPVLLDPEQRQLVDELGKQLVASTDGVSVQGNPSAYERMGQVIGRAIGTSGSSGAANELDASAEALQSGLSTAELFAADGTPEGRADLVLVLAAPGVKNAGPDQEEDPTASFESSGSGEILASLLTGLDARVDGVVVAGPTSASADDGAIRAVRADVGAARSISTVDPVNLVAGKVAAVLALVQQADGGSGRYSAEAGADGSLPPLPDGVAAPDDQG